MDMLEKGQNQPKISAKRLKFEETVEDEGEDRISALQDCLILEILSRLPSTKDAIRTGTLSNRWKHLWNSVPTLSFTNIDYYPFPQYLQNPNSRSDFVSFVDKTLTRCPQLKLKKFEVHTGYDIRLESQVKNWIRYAISCNVEQLILRFWNMESKVEVLIDQFFFLSSCFTDLTLEGRKLNPTGAISWKNLRKLCISSVKIDEDLIENILSGSPLLETLGLNYGGYKRLDITSKSVKNLVISGYMDRENVLGEEIIEINAPNIFSLTIKGYLLLLKLLFLNVSSVVEANLDYFKLGYEETTRKEAEEEMLKGLILNLCHVTKLKIWGSCSKVLSHLKTKGFVFPSNLNLKFPFVIHQSSLM